MTQLMVTFCNFANGPKIYYKKWVEHFKETPENWIFKMGYRHTTNSEGRESRHTRRHRGTVLNTRI